MYGVVPPCFFFLFRILFYFSIDAFDRFLKKGKSIKKRRMDRRPTSLLVGE